MSKTLLRHARNTLVIALVLAAAAFTLTPAWVAEAATTGAGYSSGGNGFLGNYITPDGTRGYCIDEQQPWPSGATGGVNLVSQVDPRTGTQGVYGDDIQKLNTGLREYGETADPTQAAAMNAIVYAFSSLNHNGYSGGVHYISSKAPREYAAVKAKYDEIWNFINANWNMTTIGGGAGTLSFNVDPLNNYEGTVTVTLIPRHASGSITLTNGVFIDFGNATSVSGVGNGAVLRVRGVPPMNTTTSYQIFGSGSFAAPVSGGYARNVRLYFTGAQQRLVSGGDPGTVTQAFTVTGNDPITRSALFSPVLGTTVASARVARGARFSDVVTFDIGADASGMTNPWRQFSGGQYVEIKATGTVYGPFESQPAEGAAVPAGAPVAGHATITTTPTDGPTVPYIATSDTVAATGGFYTWVWVIDSADQPGVNSVFMPSGYYFADRFGRVAESHTVATWLEFSTQLNLPKQTIGDTVTDTITPRLLNGFWLHIGGTPVPVTLTGTAYYSATPPVQSASAPATATVVGTMTATLLDQTAIVETMPALPYKHGWVTYQWCIDPAQQPAALQGLVLGFCDDYGVPDETVELDGPALSTLAQPLATPTGTVSDTLTVTGPVPAVGLDVVYRGYLQPAPPLSSVLTPPAPNSGPITTPPATALCDPTTLIWQSATPQHVTTAGTYSSEAFPVTPAHLGTVYWVETATIGGTTDVWHEGVCGLTNETTTVAYPTVTTQAIAHAALGQSIHDTAVVHGATSAGATLTFDAYRVGSEGLCRPQDLVARLASTTPVTGAGAYTSAEFAPQAAGTYMWIAVVRAADGSILTAGRCGDPDEMSVLSLLPVTGVALGNTVAMALLLVVAGGVLRVRRRRIVRNG